MNTLNYNFIKRHYLENQIKRAINVPLQSLKTLLNKHINKIDGLDFFDIDQGFDL